MSHAAHRVLALAVPVLIVALAWAVPALPAEPSGGDYQVDIMKKGLGKEAMIKKGDKEWFMMIEVTPENTVIIRQEKDKDVYLVDESETHDRAMTADEVNAAIDAFVNSVKAQGKLNKK